MSRVRHNVAANIAGQIWAVLIAIFCTPFLIKLLGIEAYALIAFYTVLQATLQMLDLGFTTTLNREVARLSSSEGAHDLGRFVATAERGYWVLGFAVGCVMLLATPQVASFWLRPENLSSDDLASSARMFGLLACLQWPLVFYQNGLAGLQRQVTLNLATIPFSALSNLGGLLVLWLGPRSVTTLMVWQLAILLAQVAVIRFQFWKHAGVPRKARVADLAVLRDKWRFSLGMGGISITGFVLTYLDKLVLSRLLSLESFGHYNLAWTLARGLYVLITPVFSAYFPRLSALASSQDSTSIRLCYHNATQVMAVLVLPLSLVMGVYSFEIALLWLHDASIARSVAPIASLLIVGTCLNGLMNIPFALQLARGNTAIGLYLNLCLIVCLAPAIILAAYQYGAVGGAAMWGMINGIYLVVGLPITHRYLLPGETGSWLRFDVAPPLIAALVIAGVGRLALPSGQSEISTLISMGSIWALATIGAALSANRIRGVIREVVRL
ncbi:MAG TPA: oligosaccharide flippase family protein [Burkholderiales bacterium]